MNFITFFCLVNEQGITHNPAYEESMLMFLHALLSLYIYIYIYYIAHRLEMRSRRVELESNPSYITVQTKRTYAVYEEIVLQ